jgi:tetratricopeptide (TPR) repeat protein
LSGGVSEILLNARLETDPQKKEAIYLKGLDKYPKDADLLANYAGFLYSTGKTDEGAEKYEQAVTIKPDFHEAYYNWGTYLEHLAKTKTGDEAETLYREAFEKYEQAVTLKPDFHEAYYNWGNDLGYLAKTKTGDEAEALYLGAFEKYEHAVTIKPDYHKAYYNWGNDLGNLAKTKTGDEAEALYREAFEKYEQAVTLKPESDKAYYNWGNDLRYFAKTKTGDEAEALYCEAIEKYRQSAALGGSSYNLACLYALRSEKDQALKYLEQNLANNAITAEYVKQDPDWKAYLADNDFIALLRRFE